MEDDTVINIFYKKNGTIELAQSVSALRGLTPDLAIWIDLLAPSGEEKHSVEEFLGVEIQSRAEAEEIESSSRFWEEENAIYANTNFMIPGPDEYSMEAVSFTLVGNSLTTLREVPLRSLTELQRRMMANPKQFTTGYHVFVTILDQRVDLDADMIELMAKEITQYSKRVNQQEDINEDFILDINMLQENAMLVRENVVDKQRLISNLLKSTKIPKELDSRLGVLLQDISSLINHANFSFERLEYLQDTVLGLINLDQNRIMKVFTLISLLLMPPTLIASFFGMNVRLPMIDSDNPNASPWNWVIIIGIMVLTFASVWFVFKKKKLL
ncbi:MAG: magnesium and cobalt transport protein CorA [Bacteroidales bacterium]|nr:magnesium and cobalt transport protein CorA [Bacteroidales bacterium]